MRRTLFALALLALLGVLYRAPGLRPLRLAPGGNRCALNGHAEAYLRQTARLLAGRFDERFYRNHVQRQMAFSFRKPQETGVSLEPFTALASEGVAGADEALAFLEEVGGNEVSLPAEALYFGGNPVNAFAEQLTKTPLSAPRPLCAALRPWPPLHSSDLFAFLFSLLTVLASFFRRSPIAALFGAAAETLSAFFAAPRPKVFPGSPAVRFGGQFPEPFFLFGPSGKQRLTVLRC